MKEKRCSDVPRPFRQTTPYEGSKKKDDKVGLTACKIISFLWAIIEHARKETTAGLDKN